MQNTINTSMYICILIDTPDPKLRRGPNFGPPGWNWRTVALDVRNPRGKLEGSATRDGRDGKWGTRADA